jgi:hypothetical protein
MKGHNPGKFIKNMGAVCDLLLNTTQPIYPRYKLGRIGCAIFSRQIKNGSHDF